MAVISTDVLTRRYGLRIGVERLCLDISPGTVFGFLGPNGSGKSTTIRVLLGFIKATEGVASVFGLDCWRDSPRIKQEVGYVPGDLRLYPWLTCRSAMDIVGAARRRALAGPGLALAEEFNLDPDLRVSSMSRGMRQALGLIIALAHDPQLLVLDEPTISLDPIMQDKLGVKFRALASKGHTVFLSSHTLGEVERLCDRVAILRKGRLVADESLESLRSRARRSVTIAWPPGIDGTEIKPPDVLDMHRRTASCWEALLTGSAKELVRWAATVPIEDLSIGQPDLESLFRTYYEDRVKD